MRALVIDDSRAVRIIIGQILREIGMEVRRGRQRPRSAGADAATIRTSSWCWWTGTCRR